MPVQPRLSAWSLATLSPSTKVSMGVGGVFLMTRCLQSLRTPVGSPSASLSMVPPSGSGVSASIPEASKALVLTLTRWPHILTMATGLSGATGSMSSLVMYLFSGHLASS